MTSRTFSHEIKEALRISYQLSRNRERVQWLPEIEQAHAFHYLLLGEKPGLAKSRLGFSGPHLSRVDQVVESRLVRVGAVARSADNVDERVADSRLVLLSAALANSELVCGSGFVPPLHLDQEFG